MIESQVTKKSLKSIFLKKTNIFLSSWYIGDELLTDADITNSNTESENEDATLTYFSTLNYAGKSDDFGKLLKCKVDHFGYDEDEHHGQSAWVDAKLNLQFKPKEIKRLQG